MNATLEEKKQDALDVKNSFCSLNPEMQKTIKLQQSFLLQLHEMGALNPNFKMSDKPK